MIWFAASPAAAQVCTAGTTVDVEPAGDAIAGHLKPNTSAVFTAGGTTVSCSSSNTTGTIPTVGNPGDPVVGVLAPPTFGSCNIGSTTTNSTNGNWTLGISCGGHATLHIPPAGAVTKILTCTITVAPNGADLPATWTNGPPGMLCVNSPVAIAHSGFGCPNVSTANFSACYNITDTTDPTQNVSVTEVP